MKKYIGIIGGVIILISVFLPAMSVLGISVSLWDGSDSRGVLYIFMAFGLIVAVCSYLEQKWSKIVAIIFAVLALIIDIIWISRAMEGIEGLEKLESIADVSSGGAGMGLWVAAIGCVMGIVGQFLKDKKA